MVEVSPDRETIRRTNRDSFFSEATFVLAMEDAQRHLFREIARNRQDLNYIVAGATNTVRAVRRSHAVFARQSSSQKLFRRRWILRFRDALRVTWTFELMTSLPARGLRHTRRWARSLERCWPKYNITSSIWFISIRRPNKARTQRTGSLAGLRGQAPASPPRRADQDSGGGGCPDYRN